jgi:hypothetical protein
MWSTKITFKSLNETLSFLVESENEVLIKDFFFGLYNIFGDINNNTIESLQKNDVQTKSQVEEFVVKFKSKFPPSINQITSFFNKLHDNEYFLFLPNIELTILLSNQLNNYLISLSRDVDLEKLNDEFESTIGKTLNDYDIKGFGGLRVFIGNKNNKKCRFCGKNEVETTFKNKAHAISEGLGNKKVFLYDECDRCNDKFSIEIEPDLINYFSIFRTFYDVKGKGGTKKIKGKNFEIIRGENVQITFQGIESRPNIEDNPDQYNIRLELQEKINSQDIYRCLVKFCLSVVSENELSKFERTIKWINKDFKIENLPMIGEVISYKHFSYEPKLFLYIRKNDNKKLPYMIGEFHLTCKLITFIVPLSDEDDFNFEDQAAFENFWKEFNHYSKVKSWVFNDYSTDDERDFTFNLNGEIKRERNKNNNE